MTLYCSSVMKFNDDDDDGGDDDDNHTEKQTF
jgi:hypothetical protein